jgi:hypothetical protein
MNPTVHYHVHKSPPLSCSQPDESGSRRLPPRSVSLSHSNSVRLAFVKGPSITSSFGIYSKIFEFILFRNFDKAWPNETVHLQVKQIPAAMKDSHFSESRFLEIPYRPNGYAVVANVVSVLGTEFRRNAYVRVHTCLSDITVLAAVLLSISNFV